uniref:RPA-interacting protein C-terminal domain-containing protein n=1 Tax=Glossina palpalis gambiensis TaxID=67801 RepID=A0A1B0B6J1_9MUSC
MNALICPVCQKSKLVIYLNKDNRYNYRCKCSVNFFFKEDPPALHSLLIAKIDTHGLFCSKRLIFFVNALTQQLEIICDTCDYFSCL